MGSRVFGYSRRSARGEERNPERQLEEHFHQHLAFAGHTDWGGAFVDLPAAKGELQYRPAGSKLFAALEAGDAVLIPSLESAFDGAAELRSALHVLAARGVKLLIIDLADHHLDPGALLAVLAAFTRLEKAGRRTRSAASRAKRRAQGEFEGGPPRYGFSLKKKGGKNVLVPCPYEREVASKIVEWKQAGWTWDVIYFHLLKHRIKTKWGGEYTRTTIQDHYHQELRAREAEAKAAAKADGQVEGNTGM